MLSHAISKPKRALMTLDAVGGLWRYSIDLARGLAANGTQCVLVGVGPPPSEAQRGECCDVPLIWTQQPLDWMVDNEISARPGG